MDGRSSIKDVSTVSVDYYICMDGSQWGDALSNFEGRGVGAPKEFDCSVDLDEDCVGVGVSHIL